MTGAQLAQRLIEQSGLHGVTVGKGAMNAYIHGERSIILRSETYRGESARSLAFAAHEVGHAEQEAQFGAWIHALRWLYLGRLWLERDASKRALRMMATTYIPNDAIREALRQAWIGYWQPAVLQTAGIAVVIAYLFIK